MTPAARRAAAGMDDAGYAFTAGMEETERETLERIYRESATIAVVGASADPSKAAHRIPAYLQEQGYRIHPVNPRGGELLGEPVATTLAEVDGPVDVVDVFRPAAEAVDIARQAVTVGAKVLWLQLGIRNDEARQLAEKAGLTVVMDRCMGATHRELGLRPARGRVGERRGEALPSSNDQCAGSASTAEGSGAYPTP